MQDLFSYLCMLLVTFMCCLIVEDTICCENVSLRVDGMATMSIVLRISI